MNNPSAKQIIDNLYCLLIDANINRNDDDVLNELNSVNDCFVDYQVKRFKKTMTKYHAIAQKNKFSEIKEELNRLRKLGTEKLLEYFTPQEKQQFQSCFRKFKELTETDEKSIMEDQELLLFIKKLKERTDNNDNPSNS